MKSSKWLRLTFTAAIVKALSEKTKEMFFVWFSKKNVTLSVPSPPSATSLTPIRT